MNGKLYLIPTPIGDREIFDEMPALNFAVIDSLDYFIVENTRSARRFLSRCRITRPIDALTFVELNEHTPSSEVSAMLEAVSRGRSVGVISEAGLPAVADPGADAVAEAHRRGIEVVPLVGPSSIILALMASGMNGQSFAFNGYLPVKQPDRTKRIKFYEHRAVNENQAQIFIEAPYRTQKLFEDFVAQMAPESRLTVAIDLLQTTQSVRTRSVAEWRKTRAEELNKRPCVFVIGTLPPQRG